MRPATTYSPNAELGVSTIGPDRLNCRVRNGNGCFPVGNITDLIGLSKNKVGVWSWADVLGPGRGCNTRYELALLAPSQGTSIIAFI